MNKSNRKLSSSEFGLWKKRTPIFGALQPLTQCDSTPNKCHHTAIWSQLGHNDHQPTTVHVCDQWWSCLWFLNVTSLTMATSHSAAVLQCTASVTPDLESTSQMHCIFAFGQWCPALCQWFSGIPTNRFNGLPERDKAQQHDTLPLLFLCYTCSISSRKKPHTEIKPFYIAHSL